MATGEGVVLVIISSHVETFKIATYEAINAVPWINFHFIAKDI